MDQAFINNDIYKHLKDNGNSKLVSIIETTYKNCEYILGEIPKEFSNYTIHDIHHAIRVINYMTEFVKPNINEYSDLHLALILLVGLLHDTGMFVSDKEKEEILAKLVPNKEKDDQQGVFQEYIRERHSKRVRKILNDYIIDKKTDSKFSSIFRLDPYNFSDDIAVICQSHTESLEWIKENLRLSKNITDYSYNPQHIALLLKLGDNLDIDARRAPYSLLKLLEIKGYSKTEWEKHSPISNYNKIQYLGDHRFHIWFDGETNDSFIYRKVAEHILWLQDTCSEISLIASKYEPPFNFDFDEEIDNRIETIGFENTELKFSLDYSSVLKLLMGEQIYGEKKAGLRELLQNSIDAIMVMQEKMAGITTSNYQPCIWIILNKSQNTISICDNGTGMDESILKKYFFNIGKSFYSSGDYKKLNLNYSAIGRFGIGFLACFMLSSNVYLETKLPTCDPIAIEFERYSPFITKIKKPKCIFDEGHGTRIHLSYNEIIPEIFESEDKLAQYVERLLLTEKYSVKIINSKNEMRLVNETDKKFKGHISTDRFEIFYSTKFPIDFCSDFTDIGMYANSMFLYFDELDSDYNDEPLLVDLMEVLTILSFVKTDQHSNQVWEYINCFAYRHKSTLKFLRAIVKEKDNVESVRKRINQYIFEKAYKKDGTLNLFSLCDQNSRFIESEGDLIDIHNKIIIFGIDKEISFSINNTLQSEFEIDTDTYRYHNIIKLNVLKSEEADVFLILLRHHSIYHASTYMHGILVSNCNIFFPYSCESAFLFDELIINVKSDEFKLDVSRNSFNLLSKENLCREISIEIFKDIAINNREGYSDVERNLIMMLSEKNDTLRLNQ